jgi:integrase
VSSIGWRVCLLPSTLPLPAEPAGFVAGLPSDWEGWLASSGMLAGTPFLLDPEFGYDVDLNGFFRSAQMLGSAWNTQAGYARDLARFLTFLWVARDRRSWRSATADDHVAFLVWRRRDELGPRISDSTWDREVAAVNSFYRWQVDAGNVVVNPIPQRRRHHAPGGGFGGGAGERPATYSHGASPERVQWLPPASYRLWRDVGVRGYTPEGLPQQGFRGRWSARNATFCDLMVRTGLRLSEQANLSLFEIPDGHSSGYQRFWLPPAVAKGRSARWVYVPGSVLTELRAYRDIDRAEVVAANRSAGRYRIRPGRWVVEDPARPVATGPRGTRVKVAALPPQDRRRLFVDGPDGLEPAAFWLSEAGDPVTVSTWKSIFRAANTRCAGRGVDVRAHPHMLRHTFAVITLEQLQRGHIAALAELSEEQRGHYTRIFGDPLDWVRRQLGHRSVVTTQIYLHALQELEMTTRMSLVPDGWDDPRDTALQPATA